MLKQGVIYVHEVVQDGCMDCSNHHPSGTIGPKGRFLAGGGKGLVEFVFGYWVKRVNDVYQGASGCSCGAREEGGTPRRASKPAFP